MKLRDYPDNGAIWKNKKSGRPDEAMSNRGPKSIGARPITGRLISANLISLGLIDEGSMDGGPIGEKLIVGGGAIGGWPDRGKRKKLDIGGKFDSKFTYGIKEGLDNSFLGAFAEVLSASIKVWSDAPTLISLASNICKSISPN